MPDVIGDEYQLVKLIQNLLENAIKFSGDQTPRVCFSAEEITEKYIFNVKDEGIGINPENFERIFEMFQKLHGSSEYSGSGVGLSLCKKIVENHGGTIWLESEEGKGSIFKFTIPKTSSIEVDL